MHKKIFSAAVALLILSALLTGCSGSDTKPSSTSTSKPKEIFTIVTSFYPMYLSAINIAKDIDGVQVINMTKPQTGCLHDYQLSPQDLKTLEGAGAFVVNGAGMEAFLDKVISQQKNLPIIEASDGIAVLKDESGTENAHVWVSVTNCIAQVKNIAHQLSVVDTVHAQQYNANANAYISKLEALKTRMHEGLDDIKNKDIITFHEAFPYFAKEFDLNIVAVIEREPGTAPTPRELEEVIGTVKTTGIKALFAEPQYSAGAAQTIANETGSTVYFLDPVVTGDAAADSYDAYITAMDNNLKTLKEALS